MASKIIQLKDGTDNLYPTMYSRSVATDSPNVNLVVCGNIIEVRINGSFAITAGSGYTTLATIPSGYRTPYTLYVPAIIGTDYNINGVIGINADGTLRLYQKTYTGTVQIVLTYTYLI